MRKGMNEVRDMVVTWGFDHGHPIGRLTLFSHDVEAMLRAGENLAFGATLKEIPPTIRRGSKKQIVGVSLYALPAVQKPEPTMGDLSKAMGKATWVWEEDLQCHVPCCTYLDPFDQRPCYNGPLVGDQIMTGDCGEHPEEEKIELSPEVAKVFREEGMHAGVYALIREELRKAVDKEFGDAGHN